MERIQNSMDRQLNYRGQITDDEQKKNDLKLSVGLQHEDGNVVFRLPKSRELLGGALKPIGMMMRNLLTGTN